MAESEKPNVQEIIHIGIGKPQLPVADTLRNQLAEGEEEGVDIFPLPDTSETPLAGSTESVGEKYKRESEQAISERRIKDFKERMVEGMFETGELLDKDHELYTTLGNIIETIKPEVKYDLYISLDDHLKAFTLKDSETLVVSAGLFTKFQDFLNAKHDGKKVTEGHIALILGHELSHWDKESDARHLGETYCDVNGFFTSTRHYNSDDAVEALEFLHWIEDERTRDRGDDPNKAFNPPITHPSPENREVMANLINNDEELFINGRYIDTKELNQQVVSDFIEKANEWKESIQRRQEIASEDDIKKEFENAKTLSQIIETFLSAEDYYTAKFIRDFADSEDFGRLLLGVASTPAKDHTILFSEFNLVYGQRAKLISKSSGRIEEAETKRPLGLSIKSYSTEKRHFQEALDGKYDNPLETLTLSKEELEQKAPDLGDFEYDDFFKLLAEGVNDLLSERKRNGEKMDGYDKNRTSVFELEPVQIEKLLYSTKNSDPDLVKQARREFLERNKYLIASHLVLSSTLRHIDFLDTVGYPSKLTDLRRKSWPSPKFQSLTNQAVDKYRTEVDYDFLYEQTKLVLNNNNICSAEELAHDVSLMIMSIDNYAKEFNDQKYSGSFEFQALPSSDPTANNDLEEFIKRKVIRIYQGSEEHSDSLKGKMQPNELFSSKTETRSRAIKEAYSNFIYSALNSLKGRGQSVTEFDLVNFYLNHAAEIAVGNQSESISLERTLVNTPEHVYKEKNPKPYDHQNYYVDRLTYYFSELKQEDLERIVLSADIKDIASEAEAALRNVNKSDLETAERILNTGIRDKALSPEHLVTVLNYFDNLELYNKYFPYVSEYLGDEYHGRLIQSEATKELLDKPSQFFAELISRGTVIKYNRSSSGGSAREQYVDLKKAHYGANGIDADDIKIYFKGNSLNILTNHLKTDEGDNFKSGDVELFIPPQDISVLGDVILEQVQTYKELYSGTTKQELLNLAIVFKLHKFGVDVGSRGEWIYGMDTGKEISHVHIPWQDQRKTIRRLIKELPNLPDCYVKDSLIRAIIQSKDKSNMVLREEEVVGLISQFSPEFFQHTGSRRYEGGFEKTPLKVKPVDISDYAYIEEPYYRALSPLNESVSYGDQKLKDLINSALSKHTETTEKIDRLLQIVPFKSEFRDLFIKQTIVDQDLASFNLQELNTIFNSSYSEDLKGKVGYEILSRTIQESDFSQGIDKIYQYFPRKSVIRDEMIKSLTLKHETSWDQINNTEEMVLGYDYSTKEADQKRQNIAHEIISTAILQMEPEEKTEFLLFLLNKDKHLTQAPRNQEEFDNFFDDSIKARISKGLQDEMVREEESAIEKTYLRWDHWNDRLSTEEKALANSRAKTRAEQTVPAVLEYLKERYLGGKVYNEDEIWQFSREVATKLGNRVDLYLNHLDEINMLQLATPESLNKVVNELEKLGQFSYNSIGASFLNGPSSERRKTFYSLCMGNKGLMSDENFEIHGKETIGNIVDLVTSKSEELWAAKDVETIKKVAVAGLRVLEPDERSERLYKFVNLLMMNGEKLTKAEILKAGFLSFKAVGAKAGQMDVLLPNPDLLREMAVAKEQVGAIPKATIVKALENTEITKNYAGLGPTLASGSIGVVVPVYKENGETDVLKIVRPELTQKEIRSQLKALKSTLGILIDEGVVSVDVNRVVDELGTMMNEEIDLRNEVRNMVHANQNIQGTEVDIKIPEVKEFGERYMIMDRISGVSLERINRIQEKFAKGEQLTEEETQFVNTELPVMYEKVVDYVFQQVFNAGEFNTDPHTGNFFVTNNGELASLDHGQYGQVEDAERKNALLLVLIGTALKNPKVTASGLRSFTPQKGTDEIAAELEKSDNLLSGVLSFISNNQVQGSINRFTKTLSNTLSPYIESLDKDTLRKLIFKHIKITDLKLMAQITRAFAGV